MGDTQNNKLTRREGNDTINGGEGDDFLVGIAGTDILFGGAGADSFVYISPDNGSDRIQDFETGIDTILIVGAVFPGNLLGGRLNESVSQFSFGDRATEANHRFIYNNANGQLLFDRDGVGGADSRLLATLSGNIELTSADIEVI